MIPFEARALLARASVISETSAATIGSSVKTGKPGGNPPPGTSASLFDQLADRFRECERRGGGWHQAIEWAAAEIESFTRRSAPPIAGETVEERDARLLTHGGWAVADVAQVFRCSASEVRKVRRRAGLDVESGDPLVRDALAVDERRRQVKARRDQNLSVRQIAEQLGIPATTVHRDLAA